jgi:hypothetical protein
MKLNALVVSAPVGADKSEITGVIDKLWPAGTLEGEVIDKGLFVTSGWSPSTSVVTGR